MNAENFSNIQQTITKILKELKATFPGWPASLKSEADETEYKKAFLKAMAQFGIKTQQQIKWGMINARNHAEAGERYLPSGATFAGWCKPNPKDLNIESFEYALKRVMVRDWESVHPAFQHVARRAEVRDVRRMKPDTDSNGCGESYTERVPVLVHDLEAIKVGPLSRSESLFRKLYDEVVRRVANGEKFEREQALERTNPTGVKVFSRERGKKVLADLIRQSKSGGISNA